MLMGDARLDRHFLREFSSFSVLNYFGVDASEETEVMPVGQWALALGSFVGVVACERCAGGSGWAWALQLCHQLISGVLCGACGRCAGGSAWRTMQLLVVLPQMLLALPDRTCGVLPTLPRMHAGNHDGPPGGCIVGTCAAVYC